MEFSNIPFVREREVSGLTFNIKQTITFSNDKVSASIEGMNRLVDFFKAFPDLKVDSKLSRIAGQIAGKDYARQLRELVDGVIEEANLFTTARQPIIQGREYAHFHNLSLFISNQI